MCTCLSSPISTHIWPRIAVDEGDTISLQVMQTVLKKIGLSIAMNVLHAKCNPLSIFRESS